MNVAFAAINRPDLVRNAESKANNEISMDEYNRQTRALETACKQFEGIMFSKLWKDMIKTAKNPVSLEEKKNAFAPLEETVTEMVSEHLSESQGIGVWKVLYEELHARLPLPAELREARAAEKAAAAEKRTNTPVRELARL